MTARRFDLEDRLIDFADRVIVTGENLPDTRTPNYLAGQILRSGTSPALNYGEAQSAESAKDFVHKMRVILKELRETSICLKILHRRSLLKDESLVGESNELVAMFTKSISTATAKL
jgi:four helix bundle protein